MPNGDLDWSLYTASFQAFLELFGSFDSLRLLVWRQHWFILLLCTWWRLSTAWNEVVRRDEYKFVIGDHRKWFLRNSSDLQVAMNAGSGPPRASTAHCSKFHNSDGNVSSPSACQLEAVLSRETWQSTASLHFGADWEYSGKGFHKGIFHIFTVATKITNKKWGLHQGHYLMTL